MRMHTPDRYEVDTLDPCASEGAQERVGSKAGATVNATRHSPRGGGTAQKGVVALAGGDGVCLNPLTEIIRGDDCPKQFCPLFDGTTLLTASGTSDSTEKQMMVSSGGQPRKGVFGRSGLRADQRVVRPASAATGAGRRKTMFESLGELTRFGGCARRVLVKSIAHGTASGCDQRAFDRTHVRICVFVSAQEIQTFSCTFPVVEQRHLD
jgi:hypothetical protein